MSWVYLPELGASKSVLNPLEDSERSAMSKKTPMPKQSSSRIWKKAISSLLRYGMMLRPLTDEDGEAWLMSLREVSRVKTSPTPEGVLESKKGLEAVFGLSFGGLLAKYSPSTSSWRTFQRLL